METKRTPVNTKANQAKAKILGLPEDIIGKEFTLHGMYTYKIVDIDISNSKRLAGYPIVCVMNGSKIYRHSAYSINRLHKEGKLN